MRGSSVFIPCVFLLLVLNLLPPKYGHCRGRIQGEGTVCHTVKYNTVPFSTIQSIILGARDSRENSLNTNIYNY